MDWMVYLALAGLILLAWTPGLEGPYQFDDYVTPVGDPASQSMADWAQHLPETLRPLSKLTYALEASLGLGDTPGVRRFISLLIHAGTAVVLMGLLARLFPEIPGWMRFGVALCWAVHPVHAENVLLISGRTAVLAGFLLLLSVFAALKGQRWAAAACFLLAGLSRETALAGLLVLGVVAWRNAGSLRERLHPIVPLLISAALLAAWYLSTNRYWELAEYSFLGRPFQRSVAAQVAAIPVGLSLYLQPSTLSVDYGIPLANAFVSRGALLGFSFYLLALALVLVGVRRSTPLAVGASLWVAAVLPTQSLIPKLDPLTNRPLGLALAGILILMTALLRPCWSSSGVPWRAVTAALVILPALALGAQARSRAHLYSSELLLWEDAASKSATNARPHLFYGLLLQSEGRLQEARGALREAAAIDPFDSRIAAIAEEMERTQ